MRWRLVPIDVGLSALFGKLFRAKDDNPEPTIDDAIKGVAAYLRDVEKVQEAVEHHIAVLTGKTGGPTPGGLPAVAGLNNLAVAMILDRGLTLQRREMEPAIRRGSKRVFRPQWFWKLILGRRLRRMLHTIGPGR